MRKLALAFVFCLFSAVAFGSHPLTVVSWDPFSGADSYEVQVKNSGGSVVVAPTANPDEDVVLGTLMDGLAAGSYQFEVRAKSGSYFSAWSSPASFSWSLEIPGTVTNIVFTD